MALPRSPIPPCNTDTGHESDQDIIEVPIKEDHGTLKKEKRSGEKPVEKEKESTDSGKKEQEEPVEKAEEQESKNRKFGEKDKVEMVITQARLLREAKDKQCLFPGCKRQFTDAKNAYVHRLSHSMKTPFVCVILECPRCFRTKNSVLRKLLLLLNAG